MKRLVFLFVLIGCPPAFAVPIAYQKIALTGDIAPGTGGLPFSKFEQSFSLLSRNGHVVFGAVATPVVSAVFEQAPGGTLSRIPLEGLTAPGANGGKFFSTNDLHVNSNGRIAFSGRLDPDTIPDVPGHYNSGLWTSDLAGNTALVYRLGAAAPGSVPGSTFVSEDGWWERAFNSQGQMIFRSISAVVTFNSAGDAISNTNSDEGIWQTDPAGQLMLVARRHMAAPGVAGGEFASVLNSNFGFNLGINDRGQTAFSANLLQNIGGVTAANDFGLWGTDTNGTLKLIAREGAPAAGFTGATYSFFQNPNINNAGELAVIGMAMKNGVNSAALWHIDPAGQVSLIAGHDQPAPGTGKFFSQFSSFPVINAQGRISFLASIGSQGTLVSSYGVWTQDAQHQLRLIAQPDTEAPGAGGGQFDTFGSREISMNARGDVLFNGNLKIGSPGVTASNNSAVWLFDSASNEVVMLAREGMLWDVNDDPNITDLRTISLPFAYSASSGGDDGRRNGLSDDGHVLLRLLFTDGSQGLFLASAVPEPASGSIFAIACLTAISIRQDIRRRRRTSDD